jgi:hypothetical protein
MINATEVDAIIGIGLSITIYHQIARKRTNEMQAFEIIMSMLEPEVFSGPDDPEAEGYEMFKAAVAKLQNASHSQLMEFSRGTLHYLNTGEVHVREPGRERP